MLGGEVGEAFENERRGREKRKRNNVRKRMRS